MGKQGKTKVSLVEGTGGENGMIQISFYAQLLFVVRHFFHYLYNINFTTMKKIFFLLFFAASPFAFSQTAVNFSCNDCSSVNHDLFTELDAGKVIVLCWVMPCGSCIAPAALDANTAQSYGSSYPGRVKFYLVDDNANTTCTSLNSWANTNGIFPDAAFSNLAISMYDYGGPGMPKTVVLGGSSHQVFYNINGAVDSHDLQLAIEAALAATGVSENNVFVSGIGLFPNPVKDSPATLDYTLTENSAVTIDIFNLFGEKVKSFSRGTEMAGQHKTTLDLSSLANGVYFIRVGTAETSSTIRFIVAE